MSVAIDPATDPLAFRNVLSRYATGVCVITCEGPLGPLGMTANSFASVSLDPPLVLWSPARSSRRAQAFVEAERYAIHVMSSDQQVVAGAFARDGAAFGGLDWHDDRGLPLIEGCLARLECRRYAVHDGGDHHVLLGRVVRAESQPGPALVFAGGTYSRLELG